MEVEFLDQTSHFPSIVRIIKVLIDNYKKLKVLIFKNWKWNEISFFNLNNKNNLEKLELIDNKITVVKFWSISKLNIINLDNCNIDKKVMEHIPHEFYRKLYN